MKCSYMRRCYVIFRCIPTKLYHVWWERASMVCTVLGSGVWNIWNVWTLYRMNQFFLGSACLSTYSPWYFKGVSQRKIEIDKVELDSFRWWVGGVILRFHYRALLKLKKILFLFGCCIKIREMKFIILYVWFWLTL